MSTEEDFIPLTTASDSETDPLQAASDAEGHSSNTFNPSTITLLTFHSLLSYYHTTAEKFYKRRAILKCVPQPTKGEKKRAQRASGSVKPIYKEPTEADLDKSQERYVEREMDGFWKLDEWRYTSFPEVLKERLEKGEAGLDKEEIVRVMEWKMKHGLPRPTLMGNVKSNKDKAVRATTTSAFKTLPSTPSDETDLEFPKSALETLTAPLRGVGPATASLILSIATAAASPAHDIPFYSDDTYLWLCLEVYPFAGDSERRTKRLARFTKPNGELNVKYNMHEYRVLYDAVGEMRRRLNHAAGKKSAREKGLREVTGCDIEKVAFVVRNIRISGFPVELEGEEERPLPPEWLEKKEKKRKEGKGKNKRKRDEDDPEAEAAAKAKRKAKYQKKK